MNPTRLNKIIDAALPVALDLQRAQKPVSVIVRKNEIVSLGANRMKTHPQAKRIGYRFEEVHSELDALLRYKGPKDGLSLFNFRFNRFSDMRMSKPCCLCLPWCEAVFDRIWYSTNEGMVQLDDSSSLPIRM